MATIRKSSSTKKLIANLFLGGGFLSTAIAGQMLLPELSQHPKTPQSFFYLFIPMIIGFIGHNLMRLFIKCPACNENIAATVMHSGGPFALAKKIRFCPCCGVNLDTDC